jgi:transposase
LSAAKARKRAACENQRAGSTLQPQTLEIADYVLVFTTLGQAFTVAKILELYRVRWQIERVLKRLKSLARLGH